MAGVGFELKKLIVKQKSGAGKGMAYANAAVVCCGSMVIGILMVGAVQWAAKKSGMALETRQMFMCLITSTMFFSMLVTSLLSMPISRYISDMIFLGTEEKLKPAFLGGTTLLILIGVPLYAVLLSISGIDPVKSTLLLLLETALIASFMLQNTVSAVRDYKKILDAYLFGLAAAGVMLYGFYKYNALDIHSMLAVVGIGYGATVFRLYLALSRAFPSRDGDALGFLPWLCKYPRLVFLGLFNTLSLLSHFILIWFSDYGTRAARFLAYAPGYDFPAILAYFSTMVSAVYFVCNLETDFYPLYRRYFSLLSGRGTLCEVTIARNEMSGAIYKGLGSCALVQCVTCLLFISAGRMILSVLNIGMTDAMLGTFQVFCVGYAFYAIGNTAQLLLIYLVDERGTLYSQVLFFLLSTLGTMATLRLGQRFWGFGFLIGAAVLAVVNVLRQL